MKPLKLTTPTSTSTRIVRTFDAPLALVWRAHTEAELVKRWSSGPEDHSLIFCEIDFRVGGSARYVWKNPQFEMGMNAEFLEIAEHERIVHTEDYDGWPEGRSTVTTTFTEQGDQTKITVDIQYQTKEARDAAMQPGFAEGYEASYKQLDVLVQDIDAPPPSETTPDQSAKAEAKTLEFDIQIDAPADKVWSTMLSSEGYTQWTAPFMAGSYFEGSWGEGERIHFLAPGGSGMVAEIAAHRPNEFLSIKHLGYVKGGVEDTTSDEVKSWAPAYENYRLTSVEGGTLVTVQHEVLVGFEGNMMRIWPKALKALKDLCESD